MPHHNNYTVNPTFPNQVLRNGKAFATCETEQSAFLVTECMKAYASARDCNGTGNVILSQKLAEDLLAYMKRSPEQRFWQALRNWSGYEKIQVKVGDRGGGATLDSFNFTDEAFARVVTDAARQDDDETRPVELLRKLASIINPVVLSPALRQRIETCLAQKRES